MPISLYLTSLNPEVEHRTIVEEVVHSRDTSWYKKTGGKENLVHWKSAYYKEVANKKHRLGTDDTIFRVFRKDEVLKLLNNEGFSVLSITNRKTYALDTFVVIAQKKK